MMTLKRTQSFPVVFLMGPTGSGKTQLALEWAKQIPCEVISVDSAMVYRCMDIGTAKPTLKEREQVPHHLIDIRDPADIYSAGDFQRDATQLIGEILGRNKLPLLVGGTMLYHKALLFGLSELPTADIELRNRIKQEANEFGWPHMHAKLEAIDPKSAERIQPNDAQRIQRALEVFELTGETMSEQQERNKPKTLPWKSICLATQPLSREILHQKIEERFDKMLEQGFVEEVQQLHARKDLHHDLPAIRSVGYQQIWDYLDGKFSFTEMRQRAIAATRQLAKRQCTWLRSWPCKINWIENTTTFADILQQR